LIAHLQQNPSKGIDDGLGVEKGKKVFVTLPEDTEQKQQKGVSEKVFLARERYKTLAFSSF
tara:strand:+ start:721 stop:903 length:183 start_codon:yes stop_codon:yes gene_type:complete